MKKNPLIKCILILHYHPKTKPANHNHYRWAAKHEQYHYRWAAGGDSGTVVSAWRASQIRTIHAEEEAGAVGVSAEAGARTEVVWSQGDAEALGVSAARTSAFVGETEAAGQNHELEDLLLLLFPGVAASAGEE